MCLFVFTEQFQWMLDSFGPGSSKKTEMKAKQMEALKRLGHVELELDEYERVYRLRGMLFGNNNETTRRYYCKRDYPP